MVEVDNRLKRIGILRGETTFGQFLCHMKLNEHVYHLTDFLRLLRNLLQKMQRINALNQVYKRHNLTDLIRLQMANEMPANVLRHLLVFPYEFLHPTLAEIAFARFIRLHQALHRMELRNANQSHAFGKCTADFCYTFFNHTSAG